jgi:hypothetical protein
MKKLFIILLLTVHCTNYSQTENEKVRGKVLFDFSGGLASRIGKPEKTGNFMLDNKINASKNGYFIDASLYVQIKPEMNHYLGVKYNNFFDLINDQKLAINFYAVSYLYSKKFTSNDLLNFSISVGYISYKDDEYFIKDYVIKGGTVGLGLEGSYLLRITDGIYSGPKIGFQFGNISEFDVSNSGNPDQNMDLNNTTESVSTFDIGLVVRIKIN